MPRDELPREAPPAGDPVALREWVTLLQDDGREAEAWAAAGITMDADDEVWADRWHRPLRGIVDVPALRALTDPAGLEAALVLWPPDGRRQYYHRRAVVLRRTADGLTARPEETSQPILPLHRLPTAGWQRSPDLDLLRHGLLTHDELHPLVRDALFPAGPAPAAYRPRHPAPPAEIRVRCLGGWHRIGPRDMPEHTPEEVRRERAIEALGAPSAGCFAAHRAWISGPAHRLPRDLRTPRRHAMSLLWHGDAAGFTRLLDAGADPRGFRARDLRSPLHLIAHLDAPHLVPRLVAAGLDVNARDATGRTPLSSALFDGASAAVVRALLDAGARTDTVDDLGSTPLHLLRSPEAATILPWLLETGLDLEREDKFGGTPLFSLVTVHAPPAAVRAVLAAGADPQGPAQHRSSKYTLARRIAESGRHDLDFLAHPADLDPRRRKDGR
jgi:hypothetical protein